MSDQERELAQREDDFATLEQLIAEQGAATPVEPQPVGGISEYEQAVATGAAKSPLGQTFGWLRDRIGASSQNLPSQDEVWAALWAEGNPMENGQGARVLEGRYLEAWATYGEELQRAMLASAPRSGADEDAPEGADDYLDYSTWNQYGGTRQLLMDQGMTVPHIDVMDWDGLLDHLAKEYGHIEHLAPYFGELKPLEGDVAELGGSIAAHRIEEMVANNPDLVGFAIRDFARQQGWYMLRDDADALRVLGELNDDDPFSYAQHIVEMTNHFNTDAVLVGRAMRAAREYWGEDANVVGFKVASDVANGLETYDNPLVAVLHAVSPALAEGLVNDRYNLDREQLSQIRDIVGENFAGDAGYEWINMRLDGVGSDGSRAGSAPNNLDVMEAARALAQSWNLPLTDEILQGIASGYDGVFAGVVAQNDNNPFGRQSDKPLYGGGEGELGGTAGQSEAGYLVGALRQTDEYKQRFGLKDPTQSEEEYVSQSANAVTALFGERNPTAINQTMEQGGDRNAAWRVGIAGEGMNSATFKRKMLEIGEVFRRYT